MNIGMYDNLFLNETINRTRAGRHSRERRRSQSLRAGTVCSRLEERVLRRGLELELQRRDVARREVDAEVLRDLRVVEEDEELEGLEDGLVVHELLGEEARGREHGESPILELLRLHLGELGRVRGLEAEGVEADVAQVVR